MSVDIIEKVNGKEITDVSISLVNTNEITLKLVDKTKLHFKPTSELFELQKKFMKLHITEKPFKIIYDEKYQGKQNIDCELLDEQKVYLLKDKSEIKEIKVINGDVSSNHGWDPTIEFSLITNQPNFEKVWIPVSMWSEHFNEKTDLEEVVKQIKAEVETTELSFNFGLYLNKLNESEGRSTEVCEFKKSKLDIDLDKQKHVPFVSLVKADEPVYNLGRNVIASLDNTELKQGVKFDCY